jgi:hypothetical protein|tara:strand:- start:111 stop:290 length:180 start_codon:yes stop_codon:yes gene_type:complete
MDSQLGGVRLMSAISRQYIVEYLDMMSFWPRDKYVFKRDKSSILIGSTLLDDQLDDQMK